MQPSSQLTRLFASIVTINVLDRVHDRSTHSRSSSQTSSFLLSLVDREVVGYITLQRASDRPRQTSWNTRLWSLSWLDGLFQPIAVTIGWSNSFSCRVAMGSLIVEPRSQEMGQLEHSRASSLPKIYECNSTSCVTFYSCTNLKRGSERDLKMLVKLTHRLLRAL